MVTCIVIRFSKVIWIPYSTDKNNRHIVRMKSHQHNDTRFRVFNMISLLYPCNQFGLDAVFCLLFCSCKNVNFSLHVKNVNQGFSKVVVAFEVNEYIYWTVNDFTHFCHPYQFMRNPFIALKLKQMELYKFCSGSTMNIKMFNSM